VSLGQLFTLLFPAIFIGAAVAVLRRKKREPSLERIYRRGLFAYLVFAIGAAIIAFLFEGSSVALGIAWAEAYTAFAIGAALGHRWGLSDAPRIHDEAREVVALEIAVDEARGRLGLGRN